MKKNHSGSFNFKTYAITMILLCCFSLAVVNIVGHLLDSKFSWRADFSRNQVMSLSATTMDVVKSLDRDINIYGVFNKKGEDLALEEILNKYGEMSNHIHVQIINMFQNPLLIKEFDPQNVGLQSGSVIVADSDNEKYKVLTHYDLYLVSEEYGIVGSTAEKAITTAIDTLDNGTTPKAVFMNGHDETAPESISAFVMDLNSANYDIRSLNMQLTDAEPAPEDILIFVSPKTDLTEQEFDTVSAFLENGGKVVLMMDNVLANQESGTVQVLPDALPRFSELLLSYSLTMNRDLIVGEQATSTVTNMTSLIIDANSHAITQRLISDDKNPIFREASSVGFPVISSSYIKVTPLLSTDENCYAKNIDTGIQSLDKETNDASGSFVVGALAEGKGTMVLFSTSSICGAEDYMLGGNRLLLLDTMAYLTETEMLDLDVKLMIDGVLNIQSQSLQTILIVVCIGVIPLLVVTAGIVVTIRRKQFKAVDNQGV